MPHDAILALAAFGAGVLNAIAGGGSFLTLPALVLGGVPPVPANATSAVAVFPGYIGSVWGQRREIAALDRRLLWQIGWVSLLGGVLGAALLLVTSNKAFQALVPWLLLFATALFALGPRARPGPEGGPPPRWRPWALGATAVYGGYFNGGLGILLMAVLSFSRAGNLHVVNALKNLVSALLAAISVAIFAAAGIVRWREAVLMMVCCTVGGYLGARLSTVLPARAVRWLVIVVGLAMSAAFFARTA
ncbi:sulfite exporter TauE/SafE family protein [Pseudorhodoferax sp.]|uniref:sulfite exporter TauE/SafE family protein n=1 Tax=Pseudorhodoferax sp. TaxID=1993553 RepID=UPI0039E2DB7C